MRSSIKPKMAILAVVCLLAGALFIYLLIDHRTAGKSSEKKAAPAVEDLNARVPDSKPKIAASPV